MSASAKITEPTREEKISVITDNYVHRGTVSLDTQDKNARIFISDTTKAEPGKRFSDTTAQIQGSAENIARTEIYIPTKSMAINLPFHYTAYNVGPIVSNHGELKTVIDTARAEKETPNMLRTETFWLTSGIILSTVGRKEIREDVFENYLDSITQSPELNTKFAQDYAIMKAFSELSREEKVRYIQIFSHLTTAARVDQLAETVKNTKRAAHIIDLPSSLVSTYELIPGEKDSPFVREASETTNTDKAQILGFMIAEAFGNGRTLLKDAIPNFAKDPVVQKVARQSEAIYMDLLQKKNATATPAQETKTEPEKTEEPPIIEITAEETDTAFVSFLKARVADIDNPKSAAGRMARVLSGSKTGFEARQKQLHAIVDTIDSIENAAQTNDWTKVRISVANAKELLNIAAQFSNSEIGKKVHLGWVAKLKAIVDAKEVEDKNKK